MKKSILLALLLMSAPLVNAAVIYTDAALFDAQVTNSTIEDFESYPLSGSTGSGASQQLDFDYFSVSTAPNAAKVIDTTFFFSQNTTPGGSQYLYIDTDRGNTGSITDFLGIDTLGISSFGFTYSYNPAWNDSLEITVDGSLFTLPDVNASGIGFWGYVANSAISSISIDSGNISAYGIDDFRFAANNVSQDVAEPSTIYLLGLGLIFAAFSRRKQIAKLKTA